jgi:hypothetical protein
MECSTLLHNSRLSEQATRVLLSHGPKDASTHSEQRRCKHDHENVFKLLFSLCGEETRISSFCHETVFDFSPCSV